MSDADATHATPSDTHDAQDAHDDGHGHDEPAEAPGPVDFVAWGYAIGGGVLGIIVVWALFVAKGG